MASSDPSTPVEVFDVIRARALDMLKLALLESGRPEPEEEQLRQLFLPVLGIGIAAASEHFARNPEHLAFAGAPICSTCREPVQTLQVGVDPAPGDGSAVVKVAWPCGHRQ